MQTKHEMLNPRFIRQATLRLSAWITLVFVLALPTGVVLRKGIQALLKER